MKVTKERKILGGLLAAGLIALGVDFATRPPAAIESTPDQSNAAIAGPEKATTVDARPAMPSFTQRLDELSKADNATQASYRDPFRAPKSWTQASEETASPAGKSFEQSHRLTAVIVAGRRSTAVINGSLVKVGQVIGGHTLVAVTQDLAVLESHNTRVVLKLDRSAISEAR
jgi:hypothetical protein